jgi:hypothetical protein
MFNENIKPILIESDPMVGHKKRAVQFGWLFFFIPKQ